MKLGGLDISSVKLGNNTVQSVYLGSNLVWANAPVATAATGVGSTSFTANWSAYTGATYYLLDVSTSSSFTTFVYENQIVASTSYVVIGLTPNTTYYYRVRASTEYDADYQAILDYATTQGYTLPSESQQLLQNTLVVDLKSAGVWSKLDTFAVFATDGNSDFALIDWIRLSQYTAVNSPTFTSNQGFTGNGTSSYIDTNFTPSTNGVNYTLDNASRMAWVSGSSTNTIIDGNANQNNNFMNKINSANQRFNSSNSMNTAADNSPDGYRLYNRTSSTNTELFVGLTQYSRTQASASLPTQSQRILASSTNRSSYLVSFYGMGASLVSENTDFYNALNTYYTSL